MKWLGIDALNMQQLFLRLNHNCEAKAAVKRSSSVSEINMMKEKAKKQLQEA